MAHPARSEPDPTVFRPLLEQAPRPGARRWFERFRLIDRGDHVEWRGRGQGPGCRWRLPHTMFPDEAFRGLAARGVPLVEEEPVAEKEFLRRHPNRG